MLANVEVPANLALQSRSGGRGPRVRFAHDLPRLFGDIVGSAAGIGNGLLREARYCAYPTRYLVPRSFTGWASEWIGHVKQATEEDGPIDEVVRHVHPTGDHATCIACHSRRVADNRPHRFAIGGALHRRLRLTWGVGRETPCVLKNLLVPAASGTGGRGTRLCRPRTGGAYEFLGLWGSGGC